MAASTLGPPPPPRLTSMWGPPRAAGSTVDAAAAASPHGFRCGAGGARTSGLFGLQRRHILCSVQLTDALRSTLQVELNSSLPHKPLMSTRCDDSTITCKGFCTVSWSIKADLLDGYLIFVTGDPITLGCWESDMAVPLAPSVESTNLWTAEIKVPCGMHFKYNYFIREEKSSSSDIIWRAGPEYSLLIPLFGRKNQVIVVKDLWMRTRVTGLPSPSWGSWLMEADLLEDQLTKGGKRQAFLKVHHAKDVRNQASSLGEHSILRSDNGAPLQGKHLLKDLSAKEDNDATDSKKPDASERSENLSERDQPVEEPWLLQSTLFTMVEAKELEAPMKDKTEQKDLIKKLRESVKPPAPLDEDKPTAGKPSSTVILINSSVCTMQRIAVLEDGKLVELLLEPIKNNVQCDSIYLGVVTKLVPHMGGAFVDIGISRPSLMSIKRNRDPFVYPQIVKEVKGDSANDSEDDDLPTYDDDDMSDDEFADEENQDDSSEFPAEHVTDREEDDMDFTTNSKTKIVDGATGFEVDDAYDEEKDDENDDHTEDEYTEDLLPVDEPGISDDLNTSPSIQHILEEYNDNTNRSRWSHVRKGTKIMVQVVKEGMGTKGPALTPFPSLRSRFWILISRGNKIGVSKKIAGIERSRLRDITKKLRPPGFSLTARTVASGHSLEELQKDLDRLLSTWKGIIEHAQSAALAAEEGVEGAVPVMLHRAMGQTLSVVQDDFNEKVKRLVVDSPRTYHEVTSYLQEVAPELCSRVELYEKRTPIFDEYNIEEQIDTILCKRVPLQNGGSLVIEQTEALVSIDVNGGHSMFGRGTSQENAVLDVNLEAAKQIARELRLRDIGGIIVVDFIDMVDDSNKRLVYEEMKKAVEKDRSTVRVSELSKLGLMEITRKRVRPSVSFMISEPCTCCHGAGRVEALDTSFSKIEHEICRLLAACGQKSDPENPKLWPRFVLRVDRDMCTYLTSGKKTKLGLLSSSLKVWILLKVARGFSRGAFEVLPYSGQKGNDEQHGTPESQPTEAGTSIPNTKLAVFPIKKWMSRGK